MTDPAAAHFKKLLTLAVKYEKNLKGIVQLSFKVRPMIKQPKSSRGHYDHANFHQSANSSKVVPWRMLCVHQIW